MPFLSFPAFTRFRTRQTVENRLTIATSFKIMIVMTWLKNIVTYLGGEGWGLELNGDFILMKIPSRKHLLGCNINNNRPGLDKQCVGGPCSNVE
jgi:hypothetical protein